MPAQTVLPRVSHPRTPAGLSLHARAGTGCTLPAAPGTACHARTPAPRCWHRQADTPARVTGSGCACHSSLLTRTPCGPCPRVTCAHTCAHRVVAGPGTWAHSKTQRGPCPWSARTRGAVSGSACGARTRMHTHTHTSRVVSGSCTHTRSCHTPRLFLSHAHTHTMVPGSACHARAHAHLCRGPWFHVSLAQARARSAVPSPAATGWAGGRWLVLAPCRGPAPAFWSLGSGTAGCHPTVSWSLGRHGRVSAS